MKFPPKIQGNIQKKTQENLQSRLSKVIGSADGTLNSHISSKTRATSVDVIEGLGR